MASTALWISCLLCTSASLFIGYAHGNPDGAPLAVCMTLLPSPGVHGAPQSGDGPYSVTTNASAEYEPNTPYQVTVASNDGTLFRGIVCQARDASTARGSSGDPVGNFALVPGLEHLTCDTSTAGTITHSSRLNVDSVSFVWTSPAAAVLNLTIRCTVVQVMRTHYLQVPSAILQAPAPVENQTVPPTTERPTAAIVANVGNITLDSCRGANPSKFCVVQPQGCTGPSDCTFIYTHRRLTATDMEFELFGALGTSGEGWVAAAFSRDETMGDDDVLGCSVDSAGFVSAKNLHNSGRVPVLDSGSATNFITLLEGTNTGNQFYCRFTRPINTEAPSGDDFDLSQSYRMFYGSRSTLNSPAAGSLTGQHEAIPQVSEGMISSASTGFGTAGSINREAVKAHGILMVLVWVGAAGIAIFMAHFMKKAWVDKPYWFLAHRGIMVCVWLVSIVAFILIFVDVKGYTESKAHGALGIVTVGLTFIQPFMSLLRCGPQDEKRWIFNFAHAFVGKSAQIVGLIAVYYGLEAYKDLGFNLKDGGTITWIVYAVITGAVFILGEIYLCIAKPGEEAVSQDMEMETKGADGEAKKEPPKQRSEDYQLRRGIFYFFLLSSVVCAIVISVYIGVAKN